MLCLRRRHGILSELKKRGINIHVAGYSVWGANMTLLIRRSKIVLNLHYYDARTLETCRIMESLSLGALVSVAVHLSYLIANLRLPSTCCECNLHVSAFEREHMINLRHTFAASCPCCAGHQRAWCRSGIKERLGG